MTFYITKVDSKILSYLTLWCKCTEVKYTLSWKVKSMGVIVDRVVNGITIKPGGHSFNTLLSQSYTFPKISTR